MIDYTLTSLLYNSCSYFQHKCWVSTFSSSHHTLIVEAVTCWCKRKGWWMVSYFIQRHTWAMCTLDPLGIILILSLNYSSINESYIEEMWRNHRGSLFHSRGVRCSVTVSFHPAHSDTMTHFWPHSCSLTHVHCCWLDVSEQEEVEVKSVVGGNTCNTANIHTQHKANKCELHFFSSHTHHSTRN